MSWPIAAILLFLAVCAQVTVAPLFPVAAAIPDMVLVTFVLVVAFAGARTSMVALPFMALGLGFLIGREPGLLLLAYLPALPLARWTELSAPRGATPFQRLLVVTLLTGLWARSLLAFGAIVNGADFEGSVLVVRILLPGAVLDLALLGVAYLPHRALRWRVRPLELARSGF